MSALVIDIETVPDLSIWQPPPVAPGEDEEFPPPYAHAVACIGALALDDELSPLKLDVICAPPEPLMAVRERAQLEAFAKAVEKGPTLITYNGRPFDLPVIEARSLHWGVPQRVLWSEAVRDRYRGRRHIDLREELTNNGAVRGRGASLDAYARLIGLPGKLAVDGSMVAEMAARGEIDRIRRYCLSDVMQTAWLYLRVKLVRDGWPLEVYRIAAGNLLDFAERDARLIELVAAIDRPRLLMEG